MLQGAPNPNAPLGAAGAPAPASAGAVLAHHLRPRDAAMGALLALIASLDTWAAPLQVRARRWKVLGCQGGSSLPQRMQQPAGWTCDCVWHLPGPGLSGLTSSWHCDHCMHACMKKIPLCRPHTAGTMLLRLQLPTQSHQMLSTPRIQTRA